MRPGPVRVAICGGGVIGAAIAYFLSTRGVRALVIERGRVVGVRLAGGGGGNAAPLRARLEVVVSCGALLTPALLQRSGIGPASVLRAAGVSGDLRNAEGDRASDVALQMKVRLQAEQLEQLRDQVRRLGAAPIA